MGLTHAYDFHGRTLIDRDGEKIGTVEELYSDRDGGQPEWALVHTGLFGLKRSFVPIKGSNPSGEDVQVAVLKEQVTDAPKVDADGELTEAEEQQLFEHYDMPYTTDGSTTATGAPATASGNADAEGYDRTEGAGVSDRDAGAGGERVDSRAASSRHESDATNRSPRERETSAHSAAGDDAMTRSEEELHVDTERRARGRARLRKYVVTEAVQTTVPVQREEVRVEREPITDENVQAATSGSDITESEHEITLHEEQPVVEKRTVPKERVRLEKDTVTDQREIADEVRKERIETERQ